MLDGFTSPRSAWPVKVVRGLTGSFEGGSSQIALSGVFRRSPLVRDKINDLHGHLTGATSDFPGAVRVDAVEDEVGMFSVELESGEQMFVAIAAVVA